VIFIRYPVATHEDHAPVAPRGSIDMPKGAIAYPGKHWISAHSFKTIEIWLRIGYRDCSNTKASSSH
jgi:hypothetical protein